jgi:hypothetical protein
MKYAPDGLRGLEPIPEKIGSSLFGVGNWGSGEGQK